MPTFKCVETRDCAELLLGLNTIRSDLDQYVGKLLLVRHGRIHTQCARVPRGFQCFCGSFKGGDSGFLSFSTQSPDLESRSLDLSRVERVVVACPGSPEKTSRAVTGERSQPVIQGCGAGVTVLVFVTCPLETARRSV